MNKNETRYDLPLQRIPGRQQYHEQLILPMQPHHASANQSGRHELAAGGTADNSATSMPLGHSSKNLALNAASGPGSVSLSH